jgi:hypothetical protein
MSPPPRPSPPPANGDAPGRDDLDVEVTDPADASDEEVAAVVAAVEMAWPRPPAPAAPDRAPRWRFSGRWWSKPVPLRRSRPW